VLTAQLFMFEVLRCGK